ncbi:MAG: hypothetical protein ABJL72_01240 [Roseobacter sp.]
MIFKMTFDLSHGFKAASGIAFHHLFDDRGRRFVTHKQLAVTVAPLVSIANRRTEDGITVHHATLHAITGLLTVLFALVLGH